MGESILDRAAPEADLRLRYGGESSQFGDLRRPPGRGPYPCVVVLHGGFWRARYDLHHLGHLCAALGVAGVATWNVEYRRVGEIGGGWPGTFLDVAAAIAHLFAIAPAHAIDPDRVVVLGHSAGGHLALWVAGLRAVPGTSPIWAEPVPLRGAVALAGVTDLRAAWRLGLSDRAVEGLIGGGPDEVPERYAAASPIDLLPLGVPTLLVHGRDDADVPWEMSAAYHAAAGARGDESTFLSLPGSGHFAPVDPSSTAWATIVRRLLPLIAR